jgi:hypothetical protein
VENEGIPDKLYHYIDAPGLLGMVNGHNLAL